jgi:hypothetical protein
VNEAILKSPQAIQALLAVLGFAFALAGHSHALAQASDQVYTVANYPVEATAESAIAAKRKAIEDGRQRAFRSLLKRLVPVTAYARLDKVAAIDTRALLASVAVRSEGEPTTRYLAALDYAFMPERVRDLLRRNALPFIDEQAPATTLVTVYRAPEASSGSLPAEMAQDQGSSLWQSLWGDLDITNALTPLSVALVSPRIRPDVIDALLSGDAGALRIFAGEHGASANREQIVVAVAEPDPATRRLKVTLVGQDAVRELDLRQSYHIFDGDLAYAMELAAVVGHGILEGRWKALKAATALTSGEGTPAGALQPLQIWVTYNSFAQWRSIQKVLHETPGVTDLTVGGQSARSASIALQFPGGGEGLRTALAPRGLMLESENGAWVLR